MRPTRPVTAAAAQRTLLLLSATRWFPVGLIIGLTTLLMLQRGLSLSQVGIVIAATRASWCWPSSCRPEAWPTRSAADRC